MAKLLSPKYLHWLLVGGVMFLIVGFGLTVVISLTGSAIEAMTGIALFVSIIGGLSVFLAINSSARNYDLQKETKEIISRVSDKSIPGLVEIYGDSGKYDYGDVLESQRKLNIVLNDGRTWVSVHREKLRQRFSNPANETTIFLIHPNSQMIPILARKGSTDARALHQKLSETIAILKSLARPDSQLEILGHHLFNASALFVGEHKAVVTPYFISRGGRTVPAFVYEDIGGPCYFRDLIDDIDRLRIDSEDISTIFDGIREPKLPEVALVRPASG